MVTTKKSLFIKKHGQDKYNEFHDAWMRVHPTKLFKKRELFKINANFADIPPNDIKDFLAIYKIRRRK